MKCPYNGFKECIVEQCPSCVYEEEVIETTKGFAPNGMNLSTALEQNYLWKERKTIYKFVSCKLAENNVQPPTMVNQNIDNSSRSSSSSTVVIRRRRIF